MRSLTTTLLFMVLLSARPCNSQAGTPAGGPAQSPTTAELLEDLRILSILNGVAPTRDQATRLADVALSAREGLARIDADARARLDEGRERARQARDSLLRGRPAPGPAAERIAIAMRTSAALRQEQTELLLARLAARVRAILTRDQAARIENELAPEFDQEWRQYAAFLAGAPRPAGARMPVDPGRWLKELRDLRVDSAEGDPNFEVQDFAKKLTRGLRTGTALFDQSFSQGLGFARQVLTMPDGAFREQERSLALAAARQELETRNQQRVQEGKPIEQFDPYRWLVEVVLFSPRAEVALRDRAARS